ncbi:putative mitochondrial respiratory complex I chaperone (Cia84) [Aspergillus undulatus]|uniref:putative mitochondrial respiratory complex I chaperone (Cia84) n=1 Tax=Aspergillus undulatus TaxID=1810928 RepID=UPI003CCDF42B
MQSQLTRRVFRAILNNEPLLSRQCHRRCLHTVRQSRSRRVVPVPFYIQRRRLFAFNFKPTTPPPSTLPSEIGLKPMSDLLISLRDKSRGPESDILAKAFQDFFETRATEPGVITDFQAQLFSTTWYHLQNREGDLEVETWQQAFCDEALGNVLYVLSEAECLPQARDTISKFARSVFTALFENSDADWNRVDQSAILAYIDVQALNGDPDEAQRTLEKFWPRLRDTDPSPWLSVVRGFAMSGGTRHIKQIAKLSNKHGFYFDSAQQEEMIQHLVRRSSDAVRLVYESPLASGQEPTIPTKIAAIKSAIFKHDTPWAEPIFESILSEPISETIGIRLLWAAAHGKDASQIAGMVESMAVSEKQPNLQASASMSCVNDMIEYAISANDPVLADGFISLASTWGLESDSRTHLLHLESRIQAGDLQGVLASLGSIDSLETTNPENLPLINKLIIMLCSVRQDEAILDHITSILDPLFENNTRLESETLTALTRTLLHHHDLEAVSELLRPRLGSYETEEKTMIRNAITDFIQDSNQASDPAWEAYELLRLAFPETGVRTRTSIMTSFFQRDRSDLAYLVFGHMRQAESFSQRPKPDTYARCFQGIAQTRDAQHLELTHNMLKLDTEVDLTTRLLNWLMLAYAECDMPEKSMQIFKDILQSEEGPSNHTLYFFFRTCEKHHNGTREAIKMVEKMKVLDIALDRRLYTAYVEALAAQCEVDLATEAMDKMKEVTGFPPNSHSIGHLYNAIPYQYWKDEVEKWAKANHSELWAQLEGIERYEDEGGLRFKIPRKDVPNF